MESSQAMHREGSPEDEGHLPVTATLAKEAAAMFQARRYQECLDILSQLSQKKEDDPKVLHNIAIAEYFHDGCTDPKKLLEVLDKVKKKSEELVRAAGDQLEGIISPSNTSSTLVPKGSGVAGGQQASASSNSDGVAFVDEYDASIATLNTAVILYHLQHYASAMSLLEPLYQDIEPIDETAALHICLLMLDIALASHEAAKAADVVQYMEKAFGFGHMAQSVDGGSNSTNQVPKSIPTTQVNLAATEGTGGVMTSNSTSFPSATANADISLTRTLSDETLDYETLFSTLGSENQNRDQRAFNFKNVLRTPKLFSISPHTFGIASATAVGAAAVAQKSATVSSASETDLNPHLQKAAAKSRKAELKDDSLRCVMYLSCWAPS